MRDDDDLGELLGNSPRREQRNQGLRPLGVKGCERLVKDNKAGRDAEFLRQGC